VTDANGNITETADQVRNDDINALFAGMSGPNVMVSRMRSDISHAAMTADFVLEASPDQSELSNIRTVTQSINETCPIYGNSCQVVGYGTVAQSNASASSVNSPSGGSFACNATATPPIGGALTFGALGAMVGLVTVRLRRRKQHAR
jgi:hypothetical protein